MAWAVSIRKSGRTRWLAVVALLGLVVAACSGGGGAVDVDGGGDGSGKLVAAIGAKPDKLDPHSTTAYASFQVLENVYDTLVVPNPKDFTFQPSLATEWSVSDDKLTWTFQLREGVTFHDGSTFDAADVVYSYTRIIERDLVTAYLLDRVTEVRAADKYTVVIELEAPRPNLLASIGSYKGTAILPEGADEKYKLDTEAVGTGPFTLEAINPGSVLLRAYEDYWGEGPYLDAVEFRVVSEPTTALTQLRTGDVDWTDNIPLQKVDDLREDEGIVLKTVPSVDYWYFTMNYEREPFGKPKVRAAVAYGINRKAVTNAATYGTAVLNQTAIPRGSYWYYDYSPYTYDPAKARRLLQQAGVSNLQMGLMVTDEYPETVRAAQVIKANLAKIGITVSIQVEDFATWLARQTDGDFDSFMLGWLGNLDPFGYYNSQHVCDGSNNYQGYCDQRTTELLNQAATETDQDQRNELYDMAVKRIVDDNSYIYLYNPQVVQAWTPKLSGYTIRGDRAINFTTVKLGG